VEIEIVGELAKIIDECLGYLHVRVRLALTTIRCLLGACHAPEIAFVFDTLGNGTELLWGTNPPQRLADTMHAAWVAFATKGDPGWPKYEISRRATMRFDTASEVVDDPRSVERELWAGVR